MFLIFAAHWLNVGERFEMYIWKVVFQMHYDDMEKGEWDDMLTTDCTVVANDYDSALETAKTEALTYSWTDEATGTEYFADGARLLEIERGIPVDAIAKNLHPDKTSPAV
jgi:hypothetical protein